MLQVRRTGSTFRDLTCPDCPWVTLDMDAASRVVTGLHVSSGAPSVISVSLAMRHVILSKAEALEERGVAADSGPEGVLRPVRVLSRLFRRFLLKKLAAARAGGRLSFFGEPVRLAEQDASAACFALLRRTEYVVYANRPSARRPRCWPTWDATPRRLGSWTSAPYASAGRTTGPPLLPRARCKSRP